MFCNHYYWSINQCFVTASHDYNHHYNSNYKDWSSYLLFDLLSYLFIIILSLLFHPLSSLFIIILSLLFHLLSYLFIIICHYYSIHYHIYLSLFSHYSFIHYHMYHYFISYWARPNHTRALLKHGAPTRLLLPAPQRWLR